MMTDNGVARHASTGAVFDKTEADFDIVRVGFGGPWERRPSGHMSEAG
jgi:hypothetical protein